MRFNELIKNELNLVKNEIEVLIPKEPKEVYEMLLPFIKRGGKRIRPTLVLLFCGAFGGDKLKAVRHAACLEVFHTFTLIHDDICDNSLMRRGKPTLHIKYGLPIAINSGDALYTLVWKGLSNSDLAPSLSLKILQICADAFQNVVEGQGIELKWYREKRFDVNEIEYFKMVKGKTASLIELSCAIGALIAGASENDVAFTKNFGRKIGIAFQIRDDILNLVGSFEDYKKEIGGDITEGKRTLIVIHAIQHAKRREREELIDILGKNTQDQKEIERAIELLKKNGSVDYASKKADKLIENAKKSLGILKESKEKYALLELIDFVVSRQR